MATRSSSSGTHCGSTPNGRIFIPELNSAFFCFSPFAEQLRLPAGPGGGWVEPSVQVEADHLLLLLSCLGEVVIALRTPEALIGGRGGLGSELVWVQCEKCLGGELELPDSCQVRPVKWWLWCAGRWECPRLDACMGWQSWSLKVLREAASVG